MKKAAPLLLFLLLAGCITPPPPSNVTTGNASNYSNGSQPPPFNPPNASNGSQPPEPPKPPLGLIVSPCDRIALQPQRDECVFNVSTSINAPSICVQIEDSTQRFSCVLLFATLDANASHCLMLNESDRCVLLVVNKAGEQACGLIKLEENKDACRLRAASFSKDPSRCLQLPNRLQDQCLGSVALNTGNESTCMSIFSQSPREKCLYSLAASKLQPSTCNLIQSPALKSECLSSIQNQSLLLQAFSSLNYSICPLLDATMADACFSRIGTSLQNISLCLKINNTGTQEKCISSQAPSDIIELAAGEVNPRPDWCPFITEPNGLQDCLLRAALASLNSTYCGLIQDSFQRQICFSYASPSAGFGGAVSSGNFNACNSLPKESEIARCHAEIAKSTSNPLACAGGFSTQEFVLECIHSSRNQSTPSSVCSILADPALSQSCVQSFPA